MENIDVEKDYETKIKEAYKENKNLDVFLKLMLDSYKGQEEKLYKLLCDSEAPLEECFLDDSLSIEQTEPNINLNEVELDPLLLGQFLSDYTNTILNPLLDAYYSNALPFRPRQPLHKNVPGAEVENVPINEDQKEAPNNNDNNNQPPSESATGISTSPETAIAQDNNATLPKRASLIANQPLATQSQSPPQQADTKVENKITLESRDHKDQDDDEEEVVEDEHDVIIHEDDGNEDRHDESREESNDEDTEENDDEDGVYPREDPEADHGTEDEDTREDHPKDEDTGDDDGGDDDGDDYVDDEEEDDDDNFGFGEDLEGIIIEDFIRRFYPLRPDYKENPLGLYSQEQKFPLLWKEIFYHEKTFKLPSIDADNTAQEHLYNCALYLSTSKDEEEKDSHCVINTVGINELKYKLFKKLISDEYHYKGNLYAYRIVRYKKDSTVSDLICTHEWIVIQNRHCCDEQKPSKYCIINFEVEGKVEYDDKYEPGPIYRILDNKNNISKKGIFGIGLYDSRKVLLPGRSSEFIDDYDGIAVYAYNPGIIRCCFVNSLNTLDCLDNENNGLFAHGHVEVTDENTQGVVLDNLRSQLGPDSDGVYKFGGLSFPHPKIIDDEFWNSEFTIVLGFIHPFPTLRNQETIFFREPLRVYIKSDTSLKSDTDPEELQIKSYRLIVEILDFKRGKKSVTLLDYDLFNDIKNQPEDPFSISYHGKGYKFWDVQMNNHLLVITGSQDNKSIYSPKGYNRDSCIEIYLDSNFEGYNDECIPLKFKGRENATPLLGLEMNPEEISEKDVKDNKGHFFAGAITHFAIFNHRMNPAEVENYLEPFDNFDFTSFQKIANENCEDWFQCALDASIGEMNWTFGEEENQEDDDDQQDDDDDEEPEYIDEYM